MNINQRLDALREEMRREGLSAFIFPSADAHNSEYTPDHWHGREWISGFDGSAGTAVVTLEKAALWTDSRYFIAAGQQLSGTDFILMKDGLPDTPSISNWLGQTLAAENGAQVGVDGYCYTQNQAETLRNELQHNGGITLRTNLDILDRIWEDRPSIPQNKVYIHPQEFCGFSCLEKLKKIRSHLKQKHVNGILISSLDEVAWTLNLRGTDVHRTPVFVAYLLLDGDKTTLYIDRSKLDNEIEAYLVEQSVAIDEYANVEKGLAAYKSYNILVDPNTISNTLFNKICCPSKVFGQSPVKCLKSVKNSTEIANIQDAMIKDGVALVKFIKWLQTAVSEGRQTEISIDAKLTELKKEQNLFRDLSFDTIAAYKEHGAIVHYEPTTETDASLEPEGLLLLDCGSQYLNGTTDITRTFSLGNITAEEKNVCTLVMKAHIQLAKAVWIEGTSGTQLDILSRGVLWKEGYHYGHGTGHGVGYFLSCHEGPQEVRMQYRPAPIVGGMILSDEPGIYLEGKFGCRLENLLLVVPAHDGVQGEKFYKFEPLTLCPFDKSILNFEMLSQEEKDWLNDYHALVYDKLSPFLTAEENLWLKEHTSAI